MKVPTLLEVLAINKAVGDAMKKLRLILSLVFLVNLACVSSAMVVPTHTPTPRVVSDVGDTTVTPAPLTETPVIENRLYKVSTDVLEVRRAPGEKSLNVGYLKKGDVVTVYETRKTTLEKCLTWARIGAGRWVCADRLQKVNHEN